MFGFSTDKGPPPDRISVGFFISPAAKGYVKVFNFFTFRDEACSMWPPRARKYKITLCEECEPSI